MRIWISLLIATAVSGCLTTQPQMAEVCRTVDRLELSKDDHLTRRTKEQIAVLNENLRKMCVD